MEIDPVEAEASAAHEEEVRRLLAANTVLGTFSRDLCARIERPIGGSLVVRTKYGELPARVSRNSGALAGRYGRLGFGGTMAMAVGQLIRWVRNQSRVPLHAWRYWASDAIKLCTEQAVALLERGGYADQTKTRCVLCGSVDGCADWWNLNGVTGPCCRYGRCRNAT